MPTFEEVLNNKNLIPSYEKFLGSIVPLKGGGKDFRAIMSLITSEGVKFIGYKESVFLLELRPAVSGGYIDSESLAYMGLTGTGSTDYLEAEYEEIKFTNERRFAYSMISQARIDAWEQSGDAGQFVNELRRRGEGAVTFMNDQSAAIFFGEGYGKVAAVADAGDQIDANGGDGEIVVEHNVLMRPNWHLQPRDANGDLVANVHLIVTETQHGRGAKAIQVINVGSANYTPIADHDLVLFKSAGEAHMPGLLDGINDTAYPNESYGNNQALDHANFKSQVFRPSQPRALTFEDFMAAESEQQSRENETYYGKTKGSLEYELYPGMWYLPTKLFDALRRDVRKDRQQFHNFPVEVDTGWGRIYNIDGVPVKVTDSMYPSTGVRAWWPSWRGKMTRPKVLSGGGMIANMTRIPQTIRHEMIIEQYMMIACTGRAEQMRLEGFSGFDGSDLDWEAA